MKNFIISLLTILTSVGVYAQQNYVSPTLTDGNYVLKRTYQAAKDSVGQVTANSEVIESVSYFDGLGRAQQSVGIAQSPTGVDIVTPYEYDGFGRTAREWLPSPTTDGGRGIYHTSSKIGTQGYYFTTYPDDLQGLFQGEVNAYSEKSFEASPRNRVLSQAAPGKDWMKGSGHEIEFEYSKNSVDEVKMFVATTVDANNTYTPSLEFPSDGQGGTVEYYYSGRLFKVVTKDENHDGTTTKNHTTEEFTDKQGRVVLKRTYANTDTNGDGTAETEVPHDTYYVYDDYGNLTYVLPPKMAASSATLATILAQMDELGYQYVYDHRNRLVEKKIPGKDWEYIVYNDLDQPIMTQDGNQREKDASSDEWLFTKYDAFGRVAYTGLATTPEATSRSAVQDEVDTFTGPLWVTSQTSDLNSDFTDNVSIFYNNVGYPNNTLANRLADLTEVLTINYYDGYDFVPATFPNPTGTGFGDTFDDRTRGLATGSRVKVLDTNEWITTVTRYDDKARPMYTYSENSFLGTVDVVESQLDFVGKPIKVYSSHTRNNNTIATLDNFEYDHMGRLLNQTQCIGNENLGYDCNGTIVDPNLTLSGSTFTSDQLATNSITISGTTTISGNVTLYIDSAAGGSGGSEELIVFNQYDELGQLVQKKVGGAQGTDYANTVGLQTVDYAYNIRGWLKQINDPTTLGSDLFAFGINYNTQSHGASTLFNGNIAETEWKTANDNTLRWYGYGYDALNRIVGATGGPTSNYDVSNITYDTNGNIITLTRQGTTGVMDNLTYNYFDSEASNRLKRVADASDNVDGFTDGVTQTTEYGYDSNGNMTSDANKGIQTDGILYNHLNLPTNIVTSSGTISYVYDAVGTKLQKAVSAGGSVTDYAGNYIYQNNTLQFFSQPEGYVTPDGMGGYDYVYQYKDHLGNIRLSYVDNGGTLEIVEENNYYPFGLKHKGYNEVVSSYGNSVAQKWSFLGQERQDEFGLNWLTFRYRNYIPEIGRFFGVDPISEEFLSISNYQFAHNNPIWKIELEGLEGVATFGLDILNIEPITYKQTSRVGKTVYVSTTTLTANGEVSTSASNENITTLTLGKNVQQSHVTDHSAIVISNNLEASGNSSATITSGYRDPQNQARVMYDNIESKGVANQKSLYGSAGDEVIDVYSESQELNNAMQDLNEMFGGENSNLLQLSPDNIRSAMTDKINEVGPGNVSKHSSNPNTLNVIDISPSSVKNGKQFGENLKVDTNIQRVILPPRDPAFHIEIPQIKL